MRSEEDFNPHEREARDFHHERRDGVEQHFNPHEREARDTTALAMLPTIINFNPHEREARDIFVLMRHRIVSILIHTSVKLVTYRRGAGEPPTKILIHTSVKLVTNVLAKFFRDF